MSPIKDLFFCGGGGLCAEIYGWLSEINETEKRWNLLGYVAPQPNAEPFPLPWLGEDTWLLSRDKACDAVLAMGDVSQREKIVAYLAQNKHILFPSIIHPSSSCDRTAVLGEGCVISPFCVVKYGGFIGNYVFLNSSVTVGHHAAVGDYSLLMPHANVLGSVRTGCKALLGAGSTIHQGLTIGDNSTVGIGSVVLNDVPSDVTVFGNPAQIIHRHDKKSS